MPTETEIKLRVAGVSQAHALLGRHGFQPSTARHLEIDELYDQPNGGLRQSDQLLRVRSSAGQWILTYKGPASRIRHKSREEVEFAVSDGGALVRVLEALGYARCFRYEKYRTKFKLGQEPGVVTLDETPIGVFLELEGPASWIDATASLLGFGESDYIMSSYGALYHQERLKNPALPADMTF